MSWVSASLCVRAEPVILDYYDDTPKVPVLTQGDTLFLRISEGYLSKKPIALVLISSGSRSIRRVPVFFNQETKNWEALVPAGVEDPVGNAQLHVLDARGDTALYLPVTIKSGNFRRQNIQVSSQTKGLEPEPGELEAVERLKRDTGPQKYWQVPLLTPTTDCANSPFGVLRYHNGVYTGNYHKGLDFKSPMGRPVKATAGGDVKIAKKMRLHGGTIGLDHGQGLSSIYIHLSKITVKTGQHVRAGDVIGEVGATGFATGPHLHWGLFVNGVPINPLQWLPQAKTCF